MHRLIGVFVFFAATLTAMGAERPAELRRLFPQEADVVVSQAGLSRLVLPPEVLAACRPDLSDLRLFDRHGNEVPFVLDSGVRTGEQRESRQTVEAKVLSAERTAGQPEVYQLAVPEPPLQGGSWDLVVRTDRSEFTRRFEVTITRPDGVIVPLARTSLLRLRKPAVEQLRVPLPPLDGQQLTITIDADAEGFLEPSFRFENMHRIEPSERTVVRLAERTREQTEGRTIIDLDRPAGLVPDVLRLETSTGAFERMVGVTDVLPGGHEAYLGHTIVFRVPPTDRTTERIEVLEVRLQPARGERLRVEINDQDSPPLAELAFAAVVRQPALIFELAPTTDATPAGTLRFGGGRADRPRYDLTDLFPHAGQPVTGPRARALARLYDPSTLGQGTLGVLRANPAFDSAPALAFAMQPGNEINAATFTHRRRLAVAPSPEGLSRLHLRPEDMARARLDQADVRVVDARGRQWSYLLEPDATSEWLDLTVAKVEHQERTSRYQLRLPVAPLRLNQIVLDPDAPYFHRPFRLMARVADQGKNTERMLAQGVLTRAAHRSAPVTIGFTAAWVQELELIVDDGDDAPLSFRGMRARLPLPELFLAAPAGEYFLLVGDPEAQAPRYELTAVRDVVLAVSSRPVEGAALENNPAYSLRARLAAGKRPRQLFQQAVLWSVLVIAVIGLTALTVRLVRHERPSDPSSP